MGVAVVGVSWTLSVGVSVGVAVVGVSVGFLILVFVSETYAPGPPLLSLAAVSLPARASVPNRDIGILAVSLGPVAVHSRRLGLFLSARD